MAELLYKILWGSWLVLFVVVTAGTIIYKISSRSTSAPLILKKHEFVDVKVCRLFPHALRPILYFSNEYQSFFNRLSVVLNTLRNKARPLEQG